MNVFLCLLFSFLSFTLSAEGVFSEPWLIYNPDQAVKTRYEVKEKTLHQSSFGYWNPEAEWENQREFPIVHLEGDVMIYDDTKGWFYTFKLLPSEANTHGYVFLKLGSSASLDELKSVVSDWEADPTDVLKTFPAFRESEAEALEAMKPLNQITREDLVRLLNARSKYSSVLEEFVKQNPGMQPFRMFRYAQVLLHKEALKLGYNPFAAMNGDPLAAFQEDEEIQSMLQSLMP